MGFSEEERARIRYHLGYGNAQPAAAISFGLPATIQTLFIVEQAMDLYPPAAQDQIRNITRIMDGIECRLVDALDRLAAIELGDLKLREDEHDKLEREYVRWGFRLADALRVPIYPYSMRYRNFMAGNSGNVPVRG